MRLPAMPDEWLDRSRTVRFRFEGRAFGAARDRKRQADVGSDERRRGLWLDQ